MCGGCERGPSAQGKVRKFCCVTFWVRAIFSTTLQAGDRQLQRPGAPAQANPDPVLTALVPPLYRRLATGDYGDLVRQLKQVLAKDANINCAAEAAGVAGALGQGLRKDFTSLAKVG